MRHRDKNWYHHNQHIVLFQVLSKKNEMRGAFINFLHFLYEKYVKFKCTLKTITLTSSSVLFHHPFIIFPFIPSFGYCTRYISHVKCNTFSHISDILYWNAFLWCDFFCDDIVVKVVNNNMVCTLLIQRHKKPKILVFCTLSKDFSFDMIKQCWVETMS